MKPETKLETLMWVDGIYEGLKLANYILKRFKTGIRIDVPKKSRLLKLAGLK